MPAVSNLTIHPYGDSAVIVNLGSQLDRNVNQQVHALASRVMQAQLPGICEVVPGYVSLVIHFDPLQTSLPAVMDGVNDLHASLGQQPLPQARRVEIPVCYGGEWGPDLDFVARHAGLTTAEVIRRHAAAEYTVYMMGFLPGFPYLGGLDVSIAAPRLETPRRRVPAGSVGIAGEQTGIYPLASPGGWRLIGRTEVALFDLTARPPCLLAPGDQVQFIPIR
ncbi:MAG TPA: 5-oxoprolinase subunit PxpB [Anaerolineaceae bacterium]|nr:5-oxoprolinase subunit PxpB [Anaerolineaceae bacterium]